jgi:beta-N-acetylhexosaminidase
MGDVVARAEAALAAGCDVLPVCNRRASVVALLDGLKSQPGPASQMRVLRMRGKEAPQREALLASQQHAQARECLERCTRPPELTLT